MKSVKDNKAYWIGQIPDDWEVIRGGFVYSIETGDLDVNAEDPEGKYPFFTCSMFPKRINYYNFDCEALLVAGNGLVGFTQYYKGKFNAYQRTYVLTNFKKILPGFLKHYVSNNLITEVTPKSQGSVIQFIKYNDLRDFNIVFPKDISKQKRIADFLDEKCSEIDKLSEDIQKEIDKLEEYKRSIIVETVTKGLDSDVRMENSGIEYVGLVPSAWKIAPLYLYFSERKNLNTILKENNLLSLSYGNIIRKDINTVGGLLPASFSTYNIVENNDIIIRPTDLQNDKNSLRTGLCKERGIITSAYIALKPKEGINSAYYHYLLHSFDIMKVFYNMGNGVRQGLNYSEFSKLMVLEPSQEEQNSIVVFLEKKVSEIDELKNIKRKQLEKLDQYKKSLIYEYVTGKKEVVDAS